MKKIALILLAASTTLSVFAQTDTTAPEPAWKWGGVYNLALTQTSLTNWAAGGNNNVNVNGLIKQVAIYSKNKWTWNNLLEANFGYNFQPDLNNKTDDRIEFTTRLDRELKSPEWAASFFANFRSQFADGFKNPEDTARISSWLAPAYLTYGLGFTNKSVEGLSIYMSPLTVKQTFVIDSVLYFDNAFFNTSDANVAELSDGGYRTEVGAYIDIIYTKAFSDKFELNSKLNLFSNYLDRPQNIDVNWETIFLMKVYSFLSVSLQLHLIYDNDVLVQDTSNDGTLNAPGTQFKQILGVGLAYTFGEFKK